MKILIYAAFYKGYGVGHILRMAYLCESFLLKKNNVDFITNDFETTNNILLKQKFKIKIIKKCQEKYDVILVDSPYNFLYDLEVPKTEKKLLNKLKTKTKSIISFDYARYKENFCNTAINLYNHNSKNIKEFKGQVYLGINYFILKNNIQQSKNKKPLINSKTQILITFSREDLKNNTKKAIEILQNFDVEITAVINKKIDYLEKNKAKLKIIPFTKKMGELLSEHDIIICGGGTTLLESMYIGNPVISIPQNEPEQVFIKEIEKKNTIFTLLEIEKLLKDSGNIVFRTKVFEEYSYYIDGKGKERILKIIEK